MECCVCFSPLKHKTTMYVCKCDVPICIKCYVSVMKHRRVACLYCRSQLDCSVKDVLDDMEYSMSIEYLVLEMLSRK